MVGIVSATTLPQPASATPPRPRRRPFFLVCLVLLRIFAPLHAVFAIAQPVTMGQYLSGAYQALELHSIFGHLLSVAAFLLGLVTLLYAIAGGRAWIAIVCGPLFFLEGFQVGMGYARQLGIHVPLGVGIVTLAVLLAIAVFLPAAGRDRGSRASRRAARS